MKYLGILMLLALSSIAATPATKSAPRSSTTQATSRPRIYKDVTEIFGLAPKKNLPDKKDGFEPLHANLLADWLKKNAPGLKLRYGYIQKSVVPVTVKDKSEVRFESNVMETNFHGAQLFFSATAHFPAADADKFLRFKYGDTVKFTGTIKSLRISNIHGHRGSFSIELDDCAID